MDCMVLDVQCPRKAVSLNHNSNENMVGVVEPSYTRIMLCNSISSPIYMYGECLFHTRYINAANVQIK